MTVTVRTNRATNPAAASTTGYAAVAGTGGAATLTNRTDGGAFGSTYNRVTWTTATTAVSGGASYTCTGLSASTQTALAVYVRSSKAQTVNVTVNFQTSVPATVNTVTSTAVALTANTWTQIGVVGVSGASVTQALITAAATTGGSNWAINDTLDVDAVLVEYAATVGTYFDGSFVSAAGVVYAWSSGANASTSTATTYQPQISLSQGSTPSPNVVVTFTDLDPATDVVNVWRTVDGKRRPVRGARRRSVVGSDFVTDYEAPLNRTISYDLEILSGVCAGVTVTTATTTITSSVSGWLSDPLAPSSAVPVYGDVGPNGEPGLDFDAFGQFEYKSAVSEMVVMGSDEPVALVGQRQAANGIDLNASTFAGTQTTALRSLLKQAGVLLLRPVSGWASGIPGLCYLAAPSVLEQSVNEKMGGSMVAWKIKGDIVAPPAANATVPTTTYGTVSGNYATYAAFVAAHPGQLYLDVIKSP
jgi:hypothetical protein